MRDQPIQQRPPAAYPPSETQRTNGGNASNGARRSKRGKNGQGSQPKRTVVINLADTGKPEDDTYLLRSAMQLLLDFPGQDIVRLEVLSNGQTTRLDMPLVTTQFCAELEERLATLIGPGRARVV